MPYAHRRWIRVVVLASSVGLALVGSSSASAQASPAGPAAPGPAMAGLGDSYASGLGAGDYDPSSGDCYRSERAYAVLDAQRIGAALDFVACSGATSGDVDSGQLGALGQDTGDVTVTVGGNDIGFADVMTECALPSWAGDCFGAIAAARRATKNVLPGNLDALYGDIASDAPDATVVVVGYPRLFNGRNCSPLTFFTKREMTKLNAAADLLDKTIRQRAKAHHFAFADPRHAFTGHAICSADPWLNDLTYPVDESFHPNADGQSGYADLVEGYLKS